MKDMEIHAHQLGIPLWSRHNEVASSQFEFAPIFGLVNVVTDQNQLLKDLMYQLADCHRLKVLLHEKPFAGFYGSGKHNYWSLISVTGLNLFQPTVVTRKI